MIRPDPIGILDIAAGIILLHTASPVPTAFAHAHSYFLILKGGGTLLKAPVLPLPVFVLGGAADIVSAAILFTGNPPLIGGYKEIIATILLLKGGLALLTMMS